MLNPDRLEATRLQVQDELKAYTARDNTEKYPLCHFLNGFHELFISGGKSSRNQYEGTSLMTPELRRLYELADQSLALEGIRKEQIEDYLHQSKQGFRSDDDDALMMPLEEMNKMLIPVYIRLRAFGFPHYPDLTA